MGLENIQKTFFKGSKEKIQEHLEQVDFDLLRTIFEEIYKKVGLNTDDMEFVKKKIQNFFMICFILQQHQE